MLYLKQIITPQVKYNIHDTYSLITELKNYLVL